MGYQPKFFGCDGLDGLLAVKNFDTKLAEGVMLLTPFAADATDDLTKKFVKEYKDKYDEVPNQFRSRQLTMQSMRSKQLWKKQK